MPTTCRPRTAVLALTGMLTLGLAACGDGTPVGTPSDPPQTSPGTTPTTPVPTPSPTTTSPGPVTSCPQQVLDQLDLPQRVGQLFMGGVQVDDDPAFVSAALGEAQVGSLLLIGQETGGVEDTAEAAERGRTVAGSPGGAAPIVAVDQEGGLVQHLKGPGFSTMPSAEEQAGMSAADLRAAAATWGAELASAEVDLDLAPVADVVPESIGDANEPIANVYRGYGSDPAAVGEHVAAFVQGMADAGVATAVKHFPGLGKVEGNTDFSESVVDSMTTRDDADLAPFGQGIQAGAGFVLVSLATYTEIDPDRRAVFSPTVIDGMIRGDLGFDGVVLSDDLGAAKEVESVPPAQRALDFLLAGGDVVVTATPSVLPEMTHAVLSRAQDDAQFAAAVDEHALRVLTAKQDMGLLTCPSS